MMDTVERTEASTSMYDGFISYSHAADGLLAPRLQSGLQRFAKPWWRRRVLRVFRDESSLAANPHLWSSITDALDASAWFVLLLSPDAAGSHWVNQEIEYWKTHRVPSRILPVVTDGEFGWDGSDVFGGAVPESLRNVFTEEPRWVDLRFARDEDQLDLKDPRFADAVADIASALRGVPKDELASEEVRQHRRTVRTVWLAGGVLVVLLVAVTVAAAYAVRQEREANRLAQVAEQSAAVAEAEADAARQAESRAVENEVRARESEEETRRQVAVVETRRLLATGVLTSQTDPQLGILLLLEARRLAPTDSLRREVVLGLGEALESDRLIDRLPLGPGRHAAAISPDATTIFVSSVGDADVRAIDIASGDVLWRNDSGTLGDPQGIAIDPLGRWVGVRVDTERDQVVILDAELGRTIRTLDVGGCGGVVPDRFSSDGRWLSVGAGSEGCGSSPDGDWSVLYETESWTPQATHQVAGAWYETIGMIGNPDRLVTSRWNLERRASHEFEGGPLEVVDSATAEVLIEIPLVEYWATAPAGTHLGYLRSRGGPARILDMVAGETFVLDEGRQNTPGVDGITTFDYSSTTPLAFSGDGRHFSMISRSHADIVFDVESGAVAAVLGYRGPTFDQSWSADGSILLTVHDDALRLWDMTDGTARRAAVRLSDDWVALALDRLDRGFTAVECLTHGIDPCPSLDEMRGR